MRIILMNLKQKDTGDLKRMEFDENWADEIEEYRKSKRSKS